MALEMAQMMRVLRLTLVLASVAWLAPPGAAQDFKTAKRVFDKDIKSEMLARRVSAVKAMAGCEDPKGVKVLVDRLAKETKALAKARKAYRKVGIAIHELAIKMVDKGGGSAQDQKNYEEKVRPLKEKQEKLNARINDTERVSHEIKVGVGQLLESLEGDARTAGVKELLAQLAKRKRGEARKDILSVLAEVHLPEIRAALHELALRSTLPTEQVAVLKALEHHASEESEALGIKLLSADAWQVRLASLSLLKIVGAELAIPAIIDRLPVEKGRLVGGVISALEHLTGQHFSDNVFLWRKWWRENSDGWTARGGKGVERAPDGHGGANGARQGDAAGIKDTGFFGIKTRSKHIIYVLDISGSMMGGISAKPPDPNGVQPPPVPVGKRKIDTAIHELVSSITSLPEDGTFNVVFYHSDVMVYKKKMVKATKKNKRKLKEWSEDVDAEGMTNIFDALEKAFGFVGRGSFDKGYKAAADTIFFLSDGVCNRGRVQKSDEMLREVRQLNGLNQVQIHCVALGRGADAGFMKALADQSGGQFVHIVK